MQTLTPAFPALSDDVTDAVNAFADALAETPEYAEYQQAALEFQRDASAQEAVRLFQEKQRSAQLMQQLGMVSQEDLTELRRLRRVMSEHPRVSAYLHSQEMLKRLCQLAMQEINAEIEMDFAGVCAPGCC